MQTPVTQDLASALAMRHAIEAAAGRSCPLKKRHAEAQCAKHAAKEKLKQARELLHMGGGIELLSKAVLGEQSCRRGLAPKVVAPIFALPGVVAVGGS